MKFRIWTILWVFALLASALATFDFIRAVPITIVILYTWHAVFVWFERPGFKLPELFMVLAVWAVLYALLNPTISRSYEPERVAECHARMTRAMRTILEYRERHKSLPEGGVFTQSNRSVHSWRALLLEQQDKGNEYDFDEPWNNPANAEVASRESPRLCCKNDSYYAKDGKSISTSYFAVIGQGTAWAAWSSESGEFSDDLSQTILLIEKLEAGIAWNEPKDLTSKEALSLLTTDPGDKRRKSSFHYASEIRFFARQPPNRGGHGVHLAFADGTVRFACLPLSQDFTSAMLTANGGETISDADFERLWKPELDYSRIYSFSVFVVLSFLSAAKFRKQQRTDIESIH